MEELGVKYKSSGYGSSDLGRVREERLLEEEGLGKTAGARAWGTGAQLQGHRVGRDELEIEARVEEEKLIRTEMGGWGGMVPVGWSGLCLDPRLGYGKSSEVEENPIADSF